MERTGPFDGADPARVLATCRDIAARCDAIDDDDAPAPNGEMLASLGEALGLRALAALVGEYAFWWRAEDEAESDWIEEVDLLIAGAQRRGGLQILGEVQGQSVILVVDPHDPTGGSAVAAVTTAGTVDEVTTEALLTGAGLISQVRRRLQAKARIDRARRVDELVDRITDFEPPRHRADERRGYQAVVTAIVGHFEGCRGSAWQRVPGGLTRRFAIEADGAVISAPALVTLEEAEAAALTADGWCLRSRQWADDESTSPKSFDLVLSIWPPDVRALLVLSASTPWTPELIDEARRLAAALQHAGSRVIAERSARIGLARDEFSAELVGIAFDANPSNVDERVAQMLELAAEFFSAHEVAIWKEDGGALRRSIAVTADGSVSDEALELQLGTERLRMEDFEGLRRVGHGFMPRSVLQGHLGTDAVEDLGSAVLVVPFTRPRGIDGIIAVSDRERRWWAEHEIDGAKGLARVLAQLDARIYAEQALRQQLELQDLIGDISSTLVDTTAHKAPEVMRGVVERVRNHFEVASVGIWHIDQESGVLSPRVAANHPNCEFERSVRDRPIDDQFVARLRSLQHPEVIRLGDIERDGEWPRPSVRLVVVPGGTASDTMWLTLVDPAGRDWDADARGALTAVLGVVAQLCRRVGAESRAEWRRHVDSLLGAVASELVDRNPTNTDGSPLAGIVELIGPALGARVVGIWQRDGGAGVVRRIHTWHDADQAVLAGDEVDLLPVGPSSLTPGALDHAHSMFIPPEVVSRLFPEERAGDAIAVVPIADRAMGLSLTFSSMPSAEGDEIISVGESLASVIDQYLDRISAQQSVLDKLGQEALLRQMSSDLLDGESEDPSFTLAPLRTHLGLLHASLWRGRFADGQIRLSWLGESAEDHQTSSPGWLRRADHVVAPKPFSQIPLNGAAELDLDGSWSGVLGGIRDLAGSRPARFLLASRGTPEDWLSVLAVVEGTEPPGQDVLDLLDSVCSLQLETRRRSEAERKFIRAFESAPNSILLCNPNGRIIAGNRALSQLLGRPESSTQGERLDALLLDGATASEVLEVDEQPREIGFSRADGSIVWGRVRATELDLPGSDDGIVLVHIEDVTEVRRQRELLLHQANHDELTGLPNRRAFVGAMEEEMRGGAPFAVLVIDLDRFKLVNDSMGHVVGDQMLVACADLLRSAIRPWDLLARFGGDEFCVLLRSPVDAPEGPAVATRLLEVLAEPLRFDGADVFPGASIGIANSGEPQRPGYVDPLRAADTAMYQAKAAGGGRFAVFDDSMREEATERMRIDAELRRAIELDQLVVHYQPEYWLDSREIIGVEALVRWNHPSRGLLGPGAFMAHAEETGVINEVGRWVLDEAVRQGARWRDAGHDLMMRVNLSARQIRPAVVAEVVEALDSSGLPRDRLCLEVTETAVMKDLDEGIEVLEALRALGVEIAVDDFGTGFSSLAYLKRLPAQIVKIDRAFVDGVGHDPDDTSIVASIIGMAEGLSLDVVAEGIETEDQIGELLRLGCRRGQGFHLAKPQPAAQVERLLQLARSAVR